MVCNYSYGLVMTTLDLQVLILSTGSRKLILRDLVRTAIILAAWLVGTLLIVVKITTSCEGP